MTNSDNAEQMDAQDRARLHHQLVKLGDMIGDGLHREPGGKWISKEYKQVATALGFIASAAKPDNAAINEKMKKFTAQPCGKCGGQLQQTRSGAKVLKCLGCGSKWKLAKAPKRRPA